MSTTKKPKKAAINKKKDSAARKVDAKAGIKAKNKKPIKGPNKKTVLAEASEHAKPKSKKSARKKAGYKNQKQKDDPILGLLEVDAIEDCIKGVEDYYKNVGSLGSQDELTIDEVLFALEFVASGFNMQLAAKAVRSKYDDERHTDDTEDDPQYYHKCTLTAKKYLAKYHVRNFIQEQINHRIERLQVTEDWIWKKYRGWANLDITNLIEIKTVNNRRIISLKKNIEDLPLEVRTSITSISVTTLGDIKVEFVNQKAALDQLCKLMNIGQDSLNLDTEVHLHFDSQDADA